MMNNQKLYERVKFVHRAICENFNYARAKERTLKDASKVNYYKGMSDAFGRCSNLVLFIIKELEGNDD